MRREDFATPTWRRIVEHVTARISELRIDNDGLVITEIQTALIRGRIDELKKILTLAQASVGTDAGPGLEDWPLHTAE